MKLILIKKAKGFRRLGLKRLMKDKDNLDYGKINAALSKASNRRHDMHIERIKFGKEIQNILTLEQKENMKSMFKNRRQSRRPFQRGERPLVFPN